MKPTIDDDKPIRDNFLVFGKPFIGKAEIKEVIDTLESGWLSTGPKVERFEEKFKEYIGCSYAVALNSCTAGLFLALETLGIKKGDEVIVPPITFPSTANVVVHLGAKPIFADIQEKSMNIDPAKIEKKITKRTKAIIPVHIAGLPCEMEMIMEIADKHKLYVVEDAAHAIETRYKNRKIGTIGDMTSFSFYATKNLTTGEGGMLVTDNYDWAEAIKIKSLHGISKDAWKRYTHFTPYETLFAGYKFNMTDIQASLGLHQLKRLDANHIRRKRIWTKYNQFFTDIEEIEIPNGLFDKLTDLVPIPTLATQHAYHLYIIKLKLEKLKINRNQFIEAMQAENIGCGVHFTALHLHKFYRETFGYKEGDYPVAESIGERVVSLPLYPDMTDKDTDDVIKAVKKIIEYYKK